MKESLETALGDHTRVGRSEPAAIALAELESDRPVLLARLILKADLPKQLAALSARLSSTPLDAGAVALFEEQLARPGAPGPSGADDDDLARRKANSAACLVRLGRPEAAWRTLETEAGPGFASYLSERLPIAGTSPFVVFNRIEVAGDAARRALIVRLGGYSIEELGFFDRERMSRRLLERYRFDPDSGVHAAIAWLLRSWGKSAAVERCNLELCSSEQSSSVRWRQDAEGNTLVLIRGPVEFPATWRDDFSQPVAVYTPVTRRINHSFAIATTEVTVDQYQRFLNEERIESKWFEKFLHGKHYVKEVSPTGNCPINSVSFYAAARYCNWLSRKVGIPHDELCYEPAEANPLGKVLIRANHVQKTGYRLPTDEEWPFASRAGTTTRYYFGESYNALRNYEWFSENSNRCTMPVGSLRPNGFGLHDTLGSLLEWTSFVPSQHTEGRQLLRGMSYNALATQLSTWEVIRANPAYPNPGVGFRVARTIAASAPAESRTPWKPGPQNPVRDQ